MRNTTPLAYTAVPIDVTSYSGHDSIDGSGHCVKFPEQEIHMPTLIETPEHLGEAVRHTRKALSLTQPQLALAAGVGGNAQRIESRRQPDTGGPGR